MAACICGYMYTVVYHKDESNWGSLHGRVYGRTYPASLRAILLASGPIGVSKAPISYRNNSMGVLVGGVGVLNIDPY